MERNFSPEERIAYYKRKWLRDHAFTLILLGIGLTGLLIAGICLKSPLLAGLAPVGVAIAHGWRHNAMMAYAEHNAFA